MRILTAIGFVAGSWLIGVAIYAVASGSEAALLIFPIPLVFESLLFGDLFHPSEIGFWAGMIVQWTVVGFVALAIYQRVQRVRAPVKRGEP
jgi:Na+-driven multidrug efflux pump